MLTALVNGRQPETDASDNLKSYTMVLAALASASERSRIELGQLFGAATEAVAIAVRSAFPCPESRRRYGTCLIVRRSWIRSPTVKRGVAEGVACRG